jgi:PDZ domain
MRAGGLMKRSITSGLAVLFTLCIGLAARPSLRAQSTAAPAQSAVASAHFAFGGTAAEIPAAFIGNLIFLPVHVNRGQPSLFELDSTAPVSSIDPLRVTELGLATTQGAVLNMTGVDISVPNLAQSASSDFGSRVGRTYEGTIGNDVLSGVVVEINYARQTVQFHAPAAFQYSGNGKSLPLTFVDGMPVVRAKFSAGGRKSGEALFIVNTALDASLVISDKFAQSHHLFSHMKTIPVAPGELNVAGNAVFVRFERLELGPFNVDAPLAVFAQGKLPGEANDHIAGEIGAGVLRRFSVVLDYPRQVMILDPNGDIRSEDRENMSGISIAASGPGWKTFEVTQVRSGTPGSDAGVQKGDLIEGVDDEAAADMSLEAIRALFRQVGHKYKLLLERNGKTLTVNVQMRRLY